MNRRQWLRHLGRPMCAATALGPGALGLAPAQGGERFPARPVSLWVPWPAGSATDSTLRLLAELAGRHLGQKVLMENRGGAGGTLVMPVLQQAAPDGYTIAQMPQTVFRAPWVQKLLWDPIRDTTPIIQISGVTFGIVVPEASPLRTLEDLFACARAHGGRLTVSTSGVGTTPHVVIEQLMSERGLQYVHVPFKGASEQMLALATGQVMVGISSNGFAPFVDDGQLRLLATFGDKRTRRWPQVPTLKELGLGIVAMSPYGLAGPAAMPVDVVKVLHDAFRAAMQEPRHVAELARFGQEPAYLSSEDYGRAMRAAFDAERRAAERFGLTRKGA